MEARKVSNVTVNDGNGLLDNTGLIESLISDCNNAVKQCVGGQYIGFCHTMVGMVQKLANLKVGYAREIEARDKHIQCLEQTNAELYGRSEAGEKE